MLLVEVVGLVLWGGVWFVDDILCILIIKQRPMTSPTSKLLTHLAPGQHPATRHFFKQFGQANRDQLSACLGLHRRLSYRRRIIQRRRRRRLRRNYYFLFLVQENVALATLLV